MDVKEIRKLIDLMVKNDLRELEISSGDSRVVLKRGPGESVPTVALGQVQPVSVGPAAVVKNSPAEQSPGEKTAGQTVEEELESFESIVSPMVGTFYPAASPESDPFVRVGDTVVPDKVVCIVEAMKVMNEIKAGLSGTVEKIMISNGEAVEFGQPLFMVRPG